MLESKGILCMAALKVKDGSIEWNGVKYSDEDALYEEADRIYGMNTRHPLVIIEKCGNGKKITH